MISRTPNPTSSLGEFTGKLIDTTAASTCCGFLYLLPFLDLTCSRCHCSHQIRQLYLLPLSLQHQIRYVGDFLIPFSNTLAVPVEKG